jgi:hypothetical protein
MSIFILAGFPMLAVGIALMWQERNEYRIIAEFLNSQDEVDFDRIYRETNIPPSRSRIYILRAIQASKITGRIIDERYVKKLIAERIDSETIRCPHCKAEMMLPKEESDSDWI